MTTTEPVTPDAHEMEARKMRRSAARIDEKAPYIGLALSGGGIRSATFCFGILRALAKNGVLHRFDYLSTVSGGGYIGAALGRLFHSGIGGDAKSVEAGIADDNSLLLWWLRNNGRFLAPAGAADLLQATSSQVRGFIATQVEMLVLIILIACAVTLPHLVYSFVYALREGMPLAMSIWWWFLPAPVLAALIACYGYWFLAYETGGGAPTAFLAAILGAYLLYQGWVATRFFDAAVLYIGAFALLPSPVAWCCARTSNGRREAAENRVRYTTALSWSIKGLGLFVSLGVLDMLSWYIRVAMNHLMDNDAGGNVATGVGITTIIIAIARFLLPLLQTRSNTTAARVPWISIANILGLVLVVALALFWTTIFQMVIFPGKSENIGTLLDSAYIRWTAVAITSIIYLALNGRAWQQLNFSSLHYFYRSRIARAYISVGNAPHAGIKPTRFPIDPLQPNVGSASATTQEITNLMVGDDVAMVAYTPHIFGGPIHLINCCINQTVDDRTGAYNADRKGINLAIGELGLETGTCLPTKASQAQIAGSTLAEWIAISGAAVGTGMGSFTRPGIAAMLFLSGLRLGFWRDNPRASVEPSRWPTSKYAAMLREMFARFPGAESTRWYLSDGGHFDNTGVYALLKRRLHLIVLADCGADPEYRFGDVENLVRKARIDYDAKIEFVLPASLGPLAGPLAPYFGTPDTISSEPDAAHLLLAQITYASGERGTLLIIKPHISTDMPLDVAGYADQERAFPQESTTRVFFSEAQWESYCELGSLLGKHVDGGLLTALPKWAWAAQVVGTNSAMLSAPAKRPPKGRSIAASVGTSIGVGAVLTALLAGWQAWDGHQKQEIDRQSSLNKDAREFDKLAQPLLSYLEASALLNMQYAPKMGTDIQNLQASARLYAASDAQRETFDKLTKYLTPVCRLTREPGQLRSCLFTLNSLRPDALPNRLEAALADYKAWRDPYAIVALSTPSSGNALNGSSVDISSAASSNLSSVDAKALAAAHASALSNCNRPNRPFTLHTQIFDETQHREISEELGHVRELGIIASDVENVVTGARLRGREVPYEYQSPTVLYSSGGEGCAQALVTWLKLPPSPIARADAAAIPLPPGIGNPNVLELWIPRSEAGR